MRRESRPLTLPDTRLNLLPIGVMVVGWLTPMVMFWMAVWGPLRPFDYPQGPMGPSLWGVVIAAGLTLAAGRLPDGYFRTRPFERNGRVYEVMGVRGFRHLATNGDLINRWRRRRDVTFRVVRTRADAADYLSNARLGERVHLALFVVGAASALHALRIGWIGWAVVLTGGNVVANLYPVLLQRYNRARIDRALSRHRSEVR